MRWRARGLDFEPGSCYNSTELGDAQVLAGKACVKLLRLVLSVLLIVYLVLFDFTRDHHSFLEALLEEHFHGGGLRWSFHHHHDEFLLPAHGSDAELALKSHGDDGRSPGHSHATVADPAQLAFGLIYWPLTSEPAFRRYRFASSLAPEGDNPPRAPPLI